jgi:hypothetical protein
MLGLVVDFPGERLLLMLLLLLWLLLLLRLLGAAVPMSCGATWFLWTKWKEGSDRFSVYASTRSDVA